MAVTVEGELPAGVTAKDLILHIIGRSAPGGGVARSSSTGAAPSVASRWRAA
jgi:homoaconitase/3-isopropylmalate dehydratase large subunit